jgi:polysaccharide chain length determinant protein (PEP-CTERM system associated)
MKTSQNQGINIAYYLALISRRRWLIIVPFCLVLVLGCILAIKLPRIYEASTVILIQPPEVSERLVQPVVTGGIESRINNISQQILSRSNLEKVIETLKQAPGTKSPDEFLEGRLANMRARIKVEVSKKMRQKAADAFSIAYEDESPAVAAQVVNALAGLFMDENIKMRESQASGTSDFLESELENRRKQLEALEQELNRYRQKFMGELPEQLETNLRTLDRLNSALNEKQRGLQSARVNLVAIGNEMAVRQNALTSGTNADSGSASKTSEEFMSLPQLKEKLSSLRSAYTDQHPDVVRLRAKIEKLEAEGAPTAPRGASPRAVDVGASAAAARQTTVISGTIRTLELEIANLNKEIAEYQRRVEVTPKRELEMLSLKRDYDNMKTSYNSLLNRKLEAEVSVSLEKKQKGEQFQIIEPAQVPSIPISPNPKKLFLFTVAAGLGLGGGLALLLEMFDTSVRKRDDIEDKFGLAILATVPCILDRKDASRRRVRMAATVASVFICLLLTAGFASLSFVGVEKTLQMVGLNG